jgi:hypothetical protein
MGMPAWVEVLLAMAASAAVLWLMLLKNLGA